MADNELILRQEIDFFLNSLPEWLKSHRDRVALVKGSRLIDFFDNELQAYEHGVMVFGTEPFLVRRVSEPKDSCEAPALTIGILRAVS